MKILMVNASFHIKKDVVGEKAVIQPMGVSYLAAYLRSKGFEVEIYEPSVYGGTHEEHFIRINNYNCDVIGFSICADEYKSETFQMINRLRKEGYKGFIVVGGHSPSLNYEAYISECPYIDCISIGEGEITLEELCSCLSRKKDWHNIHGIAYRDTIRDNVVVTSPRELIKDIDTIPFPARDILALRAEYLGDKAVAYLLSSRGCYQNCSFCSVATYYNLQCGNRFRYRSIANIVQEIKFVYDSFGITRFSFIDDNFVLPGEKGIVRCKEFNSLIKKCSFKITFEINTRVDTINKESIEFLKEVGLRNICIGIESFLESDLQIYNKNITRQQIETTLSDLSEVGYSTKVGSEYRVRTYMIVFNPYTTVDGLLEHLVYLRKYYISPKKMLTILTVYDHTDIKKRLLEEGLLYGKNEWTFKNKEVGSIYSSFSKYVKHVMKVREKIRTIQKLAIKNEYTINNTALDEAREYIDESCYNYLEKLLYVVKGNPDQTNFSFNCEYMSAIKEINEYIVKTASENELHELEKVLNIDLDNLYIYDDL